MASGRAWLIAGMLIAGLSASTIDAAAADGVQLPDGTRVEHVDFERHVAGLFTRLGCNASSCHGSAEGQRGFKLSLFGGSPQQDFAAITAAETGRVVVAAPSESLLLRKPTGQIDHEGGVRLQPGSWEFELLRRWIADGANHAPGSARIARLTLEPAELPALALGQAHELNVHARFADGTEECVSAWAQFRSRDERVAEVTPSGVLTPRGPGATHVIVSYQNAFATLEVMVAYPPADSPPSSPLVSFNFIDDEINAQLSRLGLIPSVPVDDGEFLRRATLDVLGTLPRPDEVRAYLVDTDLAKREKLIARLLAHPRRAAWWATRMCDITACNVNTMEDPPELRPKRAKMWHDWFRARFADNMPYDQIVRGVLCATSRNNQPIDDWIDFATALEQSAAAGFESNYHQRPSLDLFWRRRAAEGLLPVEDLAELTASAFLGLRMHCARCHQHPFDRWSQRDFAVYAQTFASTELGSSTELRTTMNARLEQRRRARQEGRPVPEATIPRVQEVFVSATARPLIDARVAGPLVPQPPGGPPLARADLAAQSPAADPREKLFAWLRQRDNPYFARNFVNRVWARYFGRGLVDPVDSFSDSNPPTHPRLLDKLAAEFAASGYDIVELERWILSSAAYGRSWRASGNNAADRQQFARWPVRSLPAEVLLDAVDAALETRRDFGPDVPVGTYAIELAPNRFTDKGVDELLQVLGRGDRKSLCECDRNTGPSLRPPIFLMSRPDVLDAGGRLTRLLREERDVEAILTECYLATLSREPDEAERVFALDHVARAPQPSAGLADIVWALINTREFSTNH
jgi:hypothetical protein